MLFNSYIFIAFLAVVLLVHCLPISWRLKKLNLLLASYVFYAVWNPPFVLLLWLSTLLDFFVGKKLYAARTLRLRKRLLGLSLVANLGMLGFFKYGNFLLENFTQLLSVAGINYQPAAPDIILPVGISFYTFQTLSYTIDMYRRKMRPEKSLLDFSLFVTFFPQLVAGPIVRPDQLLPQFKTARQATRENFLSGLFLLTLGLFMKIVCADTMLAGAADTVFGATQHLLPVDAWLGVLAFSGRYFLISPGILPVPLAWPPASASGCRKTLNILTPPPGSPISGGAGISPFLPGYVTMCISRLVATGWANSAPMQIL